MKYIFSTQYTVDVIAIEDHRVQELSRIKKGLGNDMDNRNIQVFLLSITGYKNPIKYLENVNN